MKEELPPTTELEESFTNGVTLAKLAHFFAPKVVPLRKIYDKDLKRFEVSLYYRFFTYELFLSRYIFHHCFFAAYWSALFVRRGQTTRCEQFEIINLS